MRDNGIIVMLRLTSMEKPIKEKEYDNSDNSIAIGITAKGYIKDGPLEEEYRSYYYKNEDGKEGEAKITITYRGDNHSEGTFSGTLYSKSHKKAVIEGKFTLKKKKK